jgi:hypothetical protein
LTLPNDADQPWRSFHQIEPDKEYLVQLSYLPLLHYRSLVPFTRWLLAIQRQLALTKSIIGYSLLAHPLQRRFWTLSVWRDKAALNNFFRPAPHAAAMKALHPHMGQTLFIEWTLKGAALPPHWDDALTRFHKQSPNDSPRNLNP